MPVSVLVPLEFWPSAFEAASGQAVPYEVVSHRAGDIATYPVDLNGRLAGRRIDIYRVELDQCRKCGHLMPTPEGQAKVKRCVKTGRNIFLKILG